MDIELHKPKFPPFSTDFIGWKVTKTYTFAGYEGTIVMNLKMKTIPGEGTSGVFNGYGTDFFEDVKIINGKAFSETGVGRVDECIIMGWPL